MDNVSVFEDEGYSGKNLERPQFKEMMKQHAQNPFDAIMVYRLDRISRSVADFSSFMVMLRKSNTATISLNKRIDSEKYSDIKYGIKFGYKNIGFNDKFYTFPYFLTFLLKRFLCEKDKT